jgi:hypothetical protein
MEVRTSFAARTGALALDRPNCLFCPIADRYARPTQVPSSFVAIRSQRNVAVEHSPCRNTSKGASMVLSLRAYMCVQ